jgi:hypothetical protein
MPWFYCCNLVSDICALKFVVLQACADLTIVGQRLESSIRRSKPSILSPKRRLKSMEIWSSILKKYGFILNSR